MADSLTAHHTKQAACLGAIALIAPFVLSTLFILIEYSVWDAVSERTFERLSFVFRIATFFPGLVCICLLRVNTVVRLVACILYIFLLYWPHMVYVLLFNAVVFGRWL